MNAKYEVIRRVAGDWYVQDGGPYDAEWQAREAAIEMAKFDNRGYSNDPYDYGVRIVGGEIVTETALRDVHGMHRDQQRRAAACEARRRPAGT